MMSNTMRDGALKDGWDYPAPFIHEVSVESRHIDDFRHTNNTIYLNWMGEAAWAHSRALGIDFDTYRGLNRGMVVRRHEMEYLAPALEGQHVQIATWITSNDGRIRLTRDFQMRNAETGATLFRGMTEFVCINMETGKPTRMPREFVEAYATTAKPRT
jgi:acyl-CoA thioester hydrolase